jgi:hypothetical protein
VTKKILSRSPPCFAGDVNYFKREKFELTKVVIYRELQQKHEQTEKMRREMVTFQRARQAWKEKQKQMLVAEERQIEEQRRAAADRSAAV